MKIVVCVKPTVDGELNPFDAAAYETALRIPDAEVTLLSMAPERAKDVLLPLTRLGAGDAVLLSDPAFAGADTLATGYTLSLAIRRLNPDLILCGRKSMEGDTAQVGVGLATRLGIPFLTGVMEILSVTACKITCRTRGGRVGTLPFPALLTVERIADLRLPSIRSRTGVVTVWDAASLGADLLRCGQNGSPTRVVRTFEAVSDRRRCRMIGAADFDRVLRECLAEKRAEAVPAVGGAKLKSVWIVGEKPRKAAETVGGEITVVPYSAPEELAARIRREDPDAVLFDSSEEGKKLSAAVAVLLETGLCADCTSLETDGETLYLYRPAFAGNIVAKIRCKTRPAMATVRTETPGAGIVFGCGVGASGVIPELSRLADRYGAELAASRAAVDRELFPYEYQVGLTGKTVTPEVYVACGISGAVHHVAGIRGSKRIIAVNSDPRAPIFDYADYGIAEDLTVFLDTVDAAKPEK